eukprot:11144882-Ditylum_brightwellii.AAC.1
MQSKVTSKLLPQSQSCPSVNSNSTSNNVADQKEIEKGESRSRHVDGNYVKSINHIAGKRIKEKISYKKG